MLLHEIKVDVGDIDPDSHGNALGHQGVQGIAFRTNKPGTVRKVYGLDSTDDPYYKFLQLIQQHQDNPFFPRIYKNTVYKNHPYSGKWGNFNMTGVVMMEKLIPLNSPKIDLQLILAMFNNLGVDVRDPARDSGFNTLMRFRRRSSLEQLMRDTPNPIFKEALNILLTIPRTFYDLHNGNWMIRLTSVGPQLVILDPMFGHEAQW